MKAMLSAMRVVRLFCNPTPMSDLPLNLVEAWDLYQRFAAPSRTAGLRLVTFDKDFGRFAALNMLRLTTSESQGVERT